MDFLTHQYTHLSTCQRPIKIAIRVSEDQHLPQIKTWSPISENLAAVLLLLDLLRSERKRAWMRDGVSRARDCLLQLQASGGGGGVWTNAETSFARLPESYRCRLELGVCEYDVQLYTHFKHISRSHKTSVLFALQNNFYHNLSIADSTLQN